MKPVVVMILMSLMSCSAKPYKESVEYNMKAGIGMGGIYSQGVGVVIESNQQNSYILTVAHICNPEIILVTQFIPLFLKQDPTLGEKLNQFNRLGQAKQFCDLTAIQVHEDDLEVLECKPELIDFARDLMICKVTKDLGVTLSIGSTVTPGEDIYMVTANVFLGGMQALLYNKAGTYMHTKSIAHSSEHLKMFSSGFPLGRGASGSPIFNNITHQLVGLMMRTFSSPSNIDGSLHINLHASPELLSEFYRDWMLTRGKQIQDRCLGERHLCSFVEGKMLASELLLWLETEEKIEESK